MPTIRPDQWQTLHATRQTALQANLMARFRELWAAQAEQLGDEAVRDWIDHAVQASRQYGLTLELDVRRYLDIMAVLGRDFDKDTRYPWASAVLADAALRPSTRIDKLSGLVVQELQRRGEASALRSTDTSTSDLDRFRAAETSAERGTGARSPSNDPALVCRNYVALELVDVEGKPVSGTRFLLSRPSGPPLQGNQTSIEGKLDDKGYAEVDVDGTEPCDVEFPDVGANFRVDPMPDDFWEDLGSEEGGA
jgi:hypothetical protein